MNSMFMELNCLDTRHSPWAEVFNNNAVAGEYRSLLMAITGSWRSVGLRFMLDWSGEVGVSWMIIGGVRSTLLFSMSSLSGAGGQGMKTSGCGVGGLRESGTSGDEGGVDGTDEFAQSRFMELLLEAELELRVC